MTEKYHAIKNIPHMHRAMLFEQIINRFDKIYLSNEFKKNSKHQKTNLKWFDKLTTLSPVEGQTPMTQIRNTKQTIAI